MVVSLLTIRYYCIILWKHIFHELFRRRKQKHMGLTQVTIFIWVSKANKICWSLLGRKDKDKDSDADSHKDMGHSIYEKMRT